MAFESHGAAAFGESWGAQLSSSLMHELSRFRDYRYTSLRDLLRVIRNKRGHFYEMSDDMQRQMGPLPDGFLRCVADAVFTGINSLQANMTAGVLTQTSCLCFAAISQSASQVYSWRATPLR